MSRTVPPLFVIGNPRSGTTLLRLMLTCHRNIVIPPECGFAVWLHKEYKDWGRGDDFALLERFVGELVQCRKFETWNLKQQGLLRHLEAQSPQSWPEAVSLVYEWYGISTGRHFTRWGDKNNFYLDHIPTIKQMFPEAFFVHIVRDGRNVACSYKRLNERSINSRYAPRLPQGIEEIALSWKTNMQTIRSAFDAIGRKSVIEIRLEDLTKRPVEELTSVCELIGEDYDPQMLQYDRMNRQNKLEPDEFMLWKEGTRQPLVREDHRRFTSELSREEIATFERIAGEELRVFGYLT